jgi:hypothetical protein
MLQRVWTAVVGTVAGAAGGLVAAILILQYGRPLDTAILAVWIIAALGAVLGFVFGGRNLK